VSSLPGPREFNDQESAKGCNGSVCLMRLLRSNNMKTGQSFQSKDVIFHLVTCSYFSSKSSQQWLKPSPRIPVMLFSEAGKWPLRQPCLILFSSVSRRLLGVGSISYLPHLPGRHGGTDLLLVSLRYGVPIFCDFPEDTPNKILRINMWLCRPPPP